MLYSEDKPYNKPKSHQIIKPHQIFEKLKNGVYENKESHIDNKKRAKH